MDLVGMAELGRRYPHQLSGGQQQRVALARALAVSPELVLLDEPFSSLDASLRQSVRGDVLEVLRKRRATVLLVTHDQDEALSSAEMVAVMRHGAIAQCGEPHDVYRDPADPEMADFLGDANLLIGTISGSFVDTDLGKLQVRESSELLPASLPNRPATAGRKVTVVIRPEQLVLGPPGNADVHSSIQATVVRAEFHGHDLRVVLEADGRSGKLRLIARCGGDSELKPADIVSISCAGPVAVWEIGQVAEESTDL